MATRADLGRGIPTGEPAVLRYAFRRTRVLRFVLVGALLAALAAALLVARQEDVRRAPLVPSGTTGIIVLDLSASVYEAGFDATIRKIARAGERVGLVAFSDAGYELLPPGSPSRELVPLLRFLRPTTTGQLPPNPWERFRAGTRITEGLKVAREALLREGVGHGSIVLMSDLEILTDEVLRLQELVGVLRDDGIGLRIVPLGPSEEKARLIRQIAGPSAVLPEPSGRAVRTPGQRSLGGAAPWLFLLAASALVALLAVNERLLPRLEVRR